MINKIKFLYTYDKMFEDLDKINKSLILDNWKPDIIFGIPRGGLIPAVHLSHSLNAKLEINNTRLNNYLHKQKNILIVDDICDSGETLKSFSLYCFKSYNEYYMNYIQIDNINSILRFAVLINNKSQNKFNPNYYGRIIDKIEDPSWIVFPWEQ